MRLLPFVASAALGIVACGIEAVGLYEEKPGQLDGGNGSSASSSSSSGSSSAGVIDSGTDPDASDASTAIDGGDAGCGDVTSDPNHCGECGHSCLGAACTAGLCASTQLADALSEPFGVVVVNGIAYIAEHTSGHIRQVPTIGGLNTLYFNTGQAPWSIAATATSIYWGEQTKVRSRPFAAVGSTDIALAAGDGCSVAVNGAKLYFGICGNGDLFRSANLDMGSPADVATAQNDPRGIAFDATHVYWSNNSGGTIVRAPLAGGASETVVTGESGSDTIAVVGSFIYWTVSGAIRRAPIGGVAPWTATTYVSGEGRPRSIKADGTRLYWLDSNLGLVRRVDTAKGPPAISLANNEAQAANTSVNSAIAFDTLHVYWITDVAGGKLKRVAK